MPELKTWEQLATDEPQKAATVKQRRLVHIGVSELARMPELVRFLSRAEAAALIDVFLNLRARYGVAQETTAAT